MKLINRAPGVDYRHLDTWRPVLSELRTDVAGFVGLAERGPIDRGVPVESWRQFTGHFGSFIGAGYLAYAVRAFFENGGARCWVVRVASRETAEAASHLQHLSSGGDAWQIKASSPGSWGNRLRVSVRKASRYQTVGRPDPSDFGASTPVDSVIGFSRGALVRLAQPGEAAIWNVIEEVDAVRSRLVWKHTDREMRFPYVNGASTLDAARPVFVESHELTFVVEEDGREVARYEEVSIIPEHPRYGPSLLAPRRYPEPHELRGEVIQASGPIELIERRELIDPADGAGWLDDGTGQPSNRQVFTLTGGIDGLARLKLKDLVGEPFSALDGDVVRRRKERGIRVLESVGEIGILAMPDVHIRAQMVFDPPEVPVCPHNPCLGGARPTRPLAPRRDSSGRELPPEFGIEAISAAQETMIDQCERLGDRIALLDPPYTAAASADFGFAEIQAWRQRFDSSYAALYYPWIKAPDPLRLGNQLVRDLPPSGHVAGEIARTDLTVGVHKAPANQVIDWARDLTLLFDDVVHGELNNQSINAIVAVPGRGLRIMGARLLTNEIARRFLNVRRFLIFVRKTLEMALQWAVFEPNNTLTRTKVFMVATNFMLSLWQRGALAGDSADAAFRVKCDEENNPPEARDNGQLLAEIWVAPVHPYEFVAVRVGRTDNSFEVTELAEVAVGGIS